MPALVTFAFGRSRPGMISCVPTVRHHQHRRWNEPFSPVGIREGKQRSDRPCRASIATFGAMLRPWIRIEIRTTTGLSRSTQSTRGLIPTVAICVTSGVNLS